MKKIRHLTKLTALIALVLLLSVGAYAKEAAPPTPGNNSVTQFDVTVYTEKKNNDGSTLNTPLFSGSFSSQMDLEFGKPVQGEDGLWTCEVTVDATKLVESLEGYWSKEEHYVHVEGEPTVQTMILHYDESQQKWLADGDGVVYGERGHEVTKKGVAFRLVKMYQVTFTPGRDLTLGMAEGEPVDGGLHFYGDEIELPQTTDFVANKGVFSGWKVTIQESRGNYVTHYYPLGTTTLTVRGQDMEVEACWADGVCGHEKTEVVGQKDPTCTEAGYTGDVVCTVCQGVIEEGKVIPATGHKFENGVCTVCGEKDPDYATPDNTLLKKTYEYAKTLSTEGVTDAAKKAFEDAMKAAEAVLGNANATQKEINDAWDALLEGIWGLGLTQGDKTMLELVMVRAQDMVQNSEKYMEDHWGELVDALAEAENIKEDGNAMQEDVDKATEALLDAILKQRYKADKSILEQLIGKAEGMDLTGYTAESVEVFRTALAKAQTVMADETLSEENQDTVDQAVDQLSVAIDGLTADPNASQKPDGEGPAQTGDTASMLTWVVAIGVSVAALTALVAVNKRRA